MWELEGDALGRGEYGEVSPKALSGGRPMRPDDPAKHAHYHMKTKFQNTKLADDNETVASF